ncbi:DUF6233 domain-containing protein [Streptomyces sp. NPDC058783]|uniref:DUF6233 domain-containing protein n=1 Tax=Streptomyces sp. NPDC058783 TaxID=3346633 RepID=UPI003693DBB4
MIGSARPRRVPRRASPPDWLLEQGLSRGSSPVYVHVGDCWNTGRAARTSSRSRPGAPSRTGSKRAHNAGRTAPAHARP